jgi:PmbA protein
MLEKAQQVFEKVQRYSTADDVEVLFYSVQSALTRFANNTIHQNVAEESEVVSIRPVFGGKTARATTNKFDDESLKQAVRNAEAIAKVQAEDPDLLPMLASSEAGAGDQPPTRYFAETASVTAEQRAETVKKMVRAAQQHKLTTAGIYSISESGEALLNSKGLFAQHRQTSAEISITMIGEDSSGWQKANFPDVTKLDAAKLAEIAAKKAIESKNPTELEPGKYTVILEPAAVLDLVGFMFFDFGGLTLLDERSFLNNRMGTKLFGENITVHDDVYHPLQSGAPYDGEGVPRKRVQLVEKGVVKNLVYARSTAERMKKSEMASKVGAIQPTGHGFPLPNEMGEAPMNIVFSGPAEREECSVDEMVRETGEGVLVTRCWYIREVDPYEKILTGMTRDGTFHVKDGKIIGGLRNFRFNQSLIEMLSKVVSMGKPVRASGEESFDMVVPAMKVNDFNFTEVTKF